MADYIKPVVFKINNQLFGVDINLVQSIEKDIEVVMVPNAMHYISGIVNLRNEVIPVFNLKKKFGFPDSSSGVIKDTAIIVDLPGMIKLALEVDEVMEIGDISSDAIVSMPMIAKTDESQYLDRVASVNKKLIILLDVAKLISESEAENLKKLAEELSND